MRKTKVRIYFLPQIKCNNIQPWSAAATTRLDAAFCMPINEKKLSLLLPPKKTFKVYKLWLAERDRDSSGGELLHIHVEDQFRIQAISENIVVFLIKQIQHSVCSML